MSLRSVPLFLRPLAVAAVIVTVVSLLSSLLSRQIPPPPQLSARSFLVWLHGLGDSGPANEPIRTFFSSPEFNRTEWSFPSAPLAPVTCNNGAVMHSWFDIYEIPVTAVSPNDENSVLEAVKTVHAIIDKEVAAGTPTKNIFICGFSQGGALTLATVLLYPKTLGGGAVFSGWVPFNSSIIASISPGAKKTPMLWFHGMVDEVVLFDAGKAAPSFLEQAGIQCEFKPQAYPSLGHSITKEELQYLEPWIRTQLKSQ
ncbi:carboxylesterase SOBER1-like isoform X1 [Zingiber officinale]|uniref:carboxylesterase SOBER1-like isoform X1 n=1 Tax=Zingiber officinale TaxID=94328 RepID=UPI001C4C76C2|nr:carboxylesterase SOBER1-like isoform X1 [Zingiber officinale]